MLTENCLGLVLIYMWILETSTKDLLACLDSPQNLYLYKALTCPGLVCMDSEFSLQLQSLVSRLRQSHADNSPVASRIQRHTHNVNVCTWDYSTASGTEITPSTQAFTLCRNACNPTQSLLWHSFLSDNKENSFSNYIIKARSSQGGVHCYFTRIHNTHLGPWTKDKTPQRTKIEHKTAQQQAQQDRRTKTQATVQ